ncbi:MAG: FHA domain-containing protein [Intestinimonas sp.]
MQNLFSAPEALLARLAALLGDYPLISAWYTSVVRFLFPVLALLILARSIRSLLNVPHTPEIWAYLTLPNGLSEPLTHWENILGRSSASDVVLGYPTVSRQHAALIRTEDGGWMLYDLGSKGGVTRKRRSYRGRVPCLLRRRTGAGRG